MGGAGNFGKAHRLKGCVVFRQFHPGFQPEIRQAKRPRPQDRMPDKLPGQT